MSRSVSSREVRLHDQDGLCRVNPTYKCPVKCREVTVKKKRVETFRNIRYVASPDRNIYIIIQKNRASCTTRLARSRSPIIQEVKGVIMLSFTV